MKEFFCELRSTFSSQWRCLLSLVADSPCLWRVTTSFMFRSLHFLLMPGEPRHSAWSKRNVGGFQYQSLPFPLFSFYSCKHLWIHSDLSSPQITEVLGLSLTVIILKEECWMWKKITCLRSLCQIPLDGEISIAAVPCFYFSILNVKLLFNGF